RFLESIVGVVCRRNSPSGRQAGLGLKSNVFSRNSLGEQRIGRLPAPSPPNSVASRQQAGAGSRGAREGAPRCSTTIAPTRVSGRGSVVQAARAVRRSGRPAPRLARGADVAGAVRVPVPCQ